LNGRDFPDYVVVGHICQDLLPDGRLVLGGSVSYAATTALRMGSHVGVVTNVGPGLDLAQALPGVQLACHQSDVTTVFENIYHDGVRTQFIHQRADVIQCKHVPHAWRKAPMVYLGSIDREIDPAIFHCFSEESLICVMPQGFYRQWDETGRVSFAEWTPSEDLLRRINVLVISELDVPEPDSLVRDWRQLVQIIVVTRAERGATVYEGDNECHYPARPAREVDLTGAGDVFAAAFLLRLAETGDACQAAGFANVAASFSVEGSGVDGIPTRQKVEDYLDTIQEEPGPLLRFSPTAP
jgi:1D-myo-inositol 3-kinase